MLLVDCLKGHCGACWFTFWWVVFFSVIPCTVIVFVLWCCSCFVVLLDVLFESLVQMVRLAGLLFGWMFCLGHWIQL